MITTLLLAVLACLPSTSVSDQPAFYAIAQPQTGTTVTKYVKSPDGNFSVEQSLTVPDSPPSGSAKREIVEYVQLSPDAKRLAVGTSDEFQQRSLRIINLSTKQVEGRILERRSTYGPWFRWKDNGTLQQARLIPPVAKGQPFKYQLWECSAPDWNKQVRVDKGDSTKHPFARPDTAAIQKRRRVAARILTSSHLSPEMGSIPGGEPTWEWEPYMGNRAIVSDDSRCIVAAVSTDEGRDLILMERSKKWEVEVLGQPRHIHYLEFWLDWVVVGDGDLVEGARQPGVPVQYVFAHMHITLHNLKTKGKALEIPGDFFLPVPGHRSPPAAHVRQGYPIVNWKHFVWIGYVEPEGAKHVMDVLDRHGILNFTEGSLAYGVAVDQKNRRAALKILKRDAGNQKYLFYPMPSRRVTI
jgi:hypothetical protein